MEKHKALVMGRIEKKRYYFRNYQFSRVGYIEVKGEFSDYKEIWNEELENPPLNIGDYLYISDMGKKVKVNDKAKSTEGGYIYWTDFVEYIEDEKTELTRLKAEKSKKEWEEYLEHLKLKEKEYRVKDFKNEITKKWWQFWK